MRSYYFTKHEATEPEFPQLLKLTATLNSIWNFQLKSFDCDKSNVHLFVCKHTQIPKRKKAEEFYKRCDKDLY